MGNVASSHIPHGPFQGHSVTLAGEGDQGRELRLWDCPLTLTGPRGVPALL